MCNFDAKSIPSGWQWICTRKPGMDEHQSCSVFCAPSGKVFKSLEEVHAHNRKEEEAKLEKEMRRSMKQDNVVNKVNVNNSVKLACNYCQNTFFNHSALKKHEREVHMRSNPRQQMLNFHQSSENSMQYNPREVESYMVETMLNKKMLVAQQLQSLHEKSGISVSGISRKNPQPNLNNVRLERTKQASKEPENRLPMLRDVSIARKPPRHQPLGPQIMEEYLGSNFQPVSNPSFFTNQQPQVKTELQAENIRNSMDTLAKFEPEYRQLQVQSSQSRPSLPSQLPSQYSQSLPLIREPAISHPRRRDISLPVKTVRGVKRNGPQKVLKKVLKSKPMRKKTINPSSVGKHQISVSMACRSLGLIDYPVPINEFNKQLFEDQSVFEAYFLPLAASVNMGKNPLSIKTLVKAKWAEVQKSKIGECKSIYFNKPKRNKVMVNVAV